MTTIQDTLPYADGSPASGRLVIYWKPFVVSNVTVAGGELEFFIVDGHVSLTLYSNANALPVGSYYNAKYELDNGAVYVEQWIVPNVATATLGQVRVSFPPSPSVIISPLQLSSLNAQAGMFLMWDGNKWVPGFPSYFNVNPNYISILAGTSGNDVNIAGSPVTLGGVLTVNVPDAGATARGVVTTGAQTFAGNKTFTGTVTATNLTVTGSVTLPPNSYVPVSRKIIAGTGLAITGNGDLTVDRTLSVVNDTTTQRVRVSSAGTLVTTRQEINFISGANATMQVSDDSANNRVNVTVGSLALADPTLAKGDMLVRSASAVTRLPVGTTDGQVLTADSTQALGVKWAASAGGVPTTRQVIAGAGLLGGGALSADVTLSVTPGIFVPQTTRVIAGSGLSGGGLLSADVTLSAVAMGASGSSHAAGIVPDPGAAAGTARFLREDATWAAVVSSFNGRTGAVVPVATDYTPAFIGAVPVTRQVLAGAGMTGGGALSADVTLAWPGVQAGLGGAVQGTEPELNFIAGAGTTLSVTDVSLSKRVDITIGLSGTGPPTNSVYSVNGTTIGTRSQLNLIAGASIVLTGVDNFAAGRVDITVAATVFGASGAAHAPGTVPDPGAAAGATRYLREDATWVVPPGGGGGVTSISPGSLSGAVTFAGGANISVTQSAQTITIAATALVTTATQVIAGPGLSGGGALSANVTLSAVPLGASGAGHAAGIAPDPGASAGIIRFLREDATWQAPPVTSVFTRTGAIAAAAGDYAAYYVSLSGSYASPPWLTQINWGIITGVPASVASPLTAKGDIHTFSTVDTKLTVGVNNTMLIADSAQGVGIKWAVPTASMVTNAVDSTQTYPNPVWISSLAWGKVTGAPAFVQTSVQVIAGAGLSGGGALTANVTLSAVPMGASGASHAAGIVPDPGATAGAVRYLREDATWATPAGGGGTPAGSTGQVQYNAGAGAFGASASLFWDITNSRLGIGTTVPLSELHVASTNTSSATRGIVDAQYSNTAHGAVFLLTKYRGTAAAPAVIVSGDYLGGLSFCGNTSSGIFDAAHIQAISTGVTSSAIDADMIFATASGGSTLERMRITGAGNVGIGTTSPTALLTVGAANVNSSSNFFQFGYGQAKTNTGTVRVGTLAQSNEASAPFAFYVSAMGGATDASRTAILQTGVEATNNSGNIALQPYAGNVGIGTTSPNGPLQVHLAANLNLNFVSSGGVATIQSFNDAVSVWNPIQYFASAHYFMNGNVGIGTTSPATFLDVGGNNGAVNSFDSAGVIRIYTNDAFAQDKGPQLRFAGHTGMGGSQEVYTFGVIAGRKEAAAAGYDGYLQFVTNTAGGLYERMRITSTGRVGIGTTTGGSGPLGILQVFDSAAPANVIIGYNGTSANYFDAGTTYFRNSTNATVNFFIRHSDGFCGINTTNPLYFLHVNADSAGKPSTNTWAIVSDVRLKRNIKELEGGLDIIKQLVPIEAEYNGLADTPEGARVVSFSAEEVRKVLPHTVKSHRAKLRKTDKEETDILDFNLHEVLIHLVLAVKQLAAKLPTS